MLNVEPTADGVIPEESVERLEEIGEWTAAHGEAIYGCTLSSLQQPAWGHITQNADGRTLFLHVFDWPDDGKLIVNDLSAKVREAELLDDDQRFSTDPSEVGLLISIPADAPDAIMPVIRLRLVAAPDAGKIVKPTTESEVVSGRPCNFRNDVQLCVTAVFCHDALTR